VQADSTELDPKMLGFYCIFQLQILRGMDQADPKLTQFKKRITKMTAIEKLSLRGFLLG